MFLQPEPLAEEELQRNPCANAVDSLETVLHAQSENRSVCVFYFYFFFVHGLDDLFILLSVFLRQVLAFSEVYAGHRVSVLCKSREEILGRH